MSYGIIGKIDLENVKITHCWGGIASLNLFSKAMIFDAKGSCILNSLLNGHKKSLCIICDNKAEFDPRADRLRGRRTPNASDMKSLHYFVNYPGLAIVDMTVPLRFCTGDTTKAGRRE